MKCATACLLVLQILAACTGAEASLATPSEVEHKIWPPVAHVTVNPDNALSTVVMFEPAAGCAQVVASAAGQDEVVTPCDRAAAAAGRAVVVGLTAQTRWSHVLRIEEQDRVAESAEVAVTTGQVPRELLGVHLDVSSAPAPGYALIAIAGEAKIYATAFDGKGTLRWYRAFDAANPTIAPELKQQPNGDFTMYLGCSRGWDSCAGEFVQFRATGETVARWSPPADKFADNHEMWLRPDGAGKQEAWYFAYDDLELDLSALSGLSQVPIAGHCLVRQQADGSIALPWSAWSTLPLSGWIEPPGPAGASVLTDFDHPNSLDFDNERGLLVVSLRNFDQIIAIDTASGQIAWSLGGVNPTLQLLGDPEGFSGQHSARWLPGDRLLIYDDGNKRSPPRSRAVEYQLDLAARTATLVWQYQPAEPIFTPYMGSVQRLAGGSTQVGFSTAGRIQEVTEAGSVVWDATLRTGDGRAGMFYRAPRIGSLYQFVAN